MRSQRLALASCSVAIAVAAGCMDAPRITGPVADSGATIVPQSDVLGGWDWNGIGIASGTPCPNCAPPDCDAPMRLGLDPDGGVLPFAECWVNSCSNAVPYSYAPMIDDAIRHLENFSSSDPATNAKCQQFGQEMRNRWNTPGRIIFHPGDQHWGSSSKFTGETCLYNKTFVHPGQLANTIAHEEAHHAGGDHEPNVPREPHPIYWGGVCGAGWTQPPM